jgi:ATPase subunit of ABC transporter with duplicated ATPase domains
MQFTILSDYRGLTPTVLTFSRRTTIVGANGSGKTSLLSLLLQALANAVPTAIPKHAYTMMPDAASEPLSRVDNLGDVSQVHIYSPLIRHAQKSNMDALLEGGGIARLWLSEGQNVMEDLGKFADQLQDPNAIFIFDELDGHLDYKGKYLFFKYFLPKIQGRVIITSHDPHFLFDETCLDLTDMTSKQGATYYQEQLLTLPLN